MTHSESETPPDAGDDGTGEEPGESAAAGRKGRGALPVLETVQEGGQVSRGAEAHAAAEAEAKLAEAGERAEKPEPEPIELSEAEAELIQLELGAMGPVPSPEREAAYQALGEATEDRLVPETLVPLLERLVAVSLESGRARRRYLAEGEKVLTGLFKRTPAGQEVQAILRGVNTALEVLEGRTLTGMKVGLRTLGHMRIVVETEDVNFTLAVRPSSVAVESVSVLGNKGGE